MFPTLVRLSKASRRPLSSKRGNKDFYKGICFFRSRSLSSHSLVSKEHARHSFQEAIVPVLLVNMSFEELRNIVL